MSPSYLRLWHSLASISSVSTSFVISQSSLCKGVHTQPCCSALFQHKCLCGLSVNKFLLFLATIFLASSVPSGNLRSSHTCTKVGSGIYGRGMNCLSQFKYHMLNVSSELYFSFCWWSNFFKMEHIHHLKTWNLFCFIFPTPEPLETSPLFPCSPFWILLHRRLLHQTLLVESQLFLSQDPSNVNGSWWLFHCFGAVYPQDAQCLMEVMWKMRFDM